MSVDPVQDSSQIQPAEKRKETGSSDEAARRKAEKREQRARELMEEEARKAETRERELRDEIAREDREREEDYDGRKGRYVDEIV